MLHLDRHAFADSHAAGGEGLDDGEVTSIRPRRLARTEQFPQLVEILVADRTHLGERLLGQLENFRAGESMSYSSWSQLQHERITCV